MPRAPAYRDPDKQDTFLLALREGGTRQDAARRLGVSVATVEGWIDRDAAFACRVESAEEIGRAARPATPQSRASKAASGAADRWERLRREAESLAPGMLGMLLYVDGILAVAGFAPMPEWWRFTIGEFYASGKRWCILRVGRGGGKSTMLCRPTILECVFGNHEWLGPGESAIWPIMSVDMDEANLKVGIVVAILGALGVPHEKHVRQQGRTRILFQDASGKDIEVRVYPATVAASSGPTLAGYTGDEEAKWKHSKEKGTDSAEDVLSAIGPAFRAREGTHGYRCSSAYLEHGSHYEDVEAGNTANHYVARLGPFCEQVQTDLRAIAANEKHGADTAALLAYADSLTPDSPNIPTWIANPSISAEATRLEARSFEDWMREYVSRSSGGTEESHFDPHKLNDAAALRVPNASDVESVSYFTALDPGSTSNAFAYATVARYKLRGGGLRFAPAHLQEWTPVPGRPLDADREIFPAAADIARDRFDCREWTTDAYLSTSAKLRGAERGITTRFSDPDIFTTEYEPAARAIHRGEVALSGCEHASELKRQLTLTRVRLLDGGKRKVTIAEEQSKGVTLHGDLGRAFVRALAAAGAGKDVQPRARIVGTPSRYASVMRART